jgi:hypothetical protein
MGVAGTAEGVFVCWSRFVCSFRKVMWSAGCQRNNSLTTPTRVRDCMTLNSLSVVFRTHHLSFLLLGFGESLCYANSLLTSLLRLFASSFYALTHFAFDCVQVRANQTHVFVQAVRDFLAIPSRKMQFEKKSLTRR